MTTPVDINVIVPSKAKAYVALIGSVLTIVGPWILTASTSLPAPWPGVVGLVFAALTSLGVFKAPYKPQGTILAPATPAVVQAATQAPQPPMVGFSIRGKTDMTIELGDGLQFPELLEIAERLNVTNLLAPELRQRLLDGTEALLAVLTGLKQVPFVLQFLPGNIAGQIDGAIDVAQLMKGLLD